MKRFSVLLCLLFMICLLFMSAGSAWSAPSKQYVAPETLILFADAAQSSTNKATLTLTALAGGAGRISARYDRGATSHAAWYKWRCWCSLTGTNVVGSAVEYYLATSDGTRNDGELGTADAALGTEKRRNLILLGMLVVDQTTTNTLMTVSGLVYVPDQYISVAVWNATALPFETSTTKHACSLTPWPTEQQ